MPVFLVVGAVQIWLGYVGIEDWLGQGWALGALASAFVLRIMLPLTIGSYIAVVDVFGYPWWAGILVAAPGLLFILPRMVMAALEPLFVRKK
ncbi:MAG: hypothetical protein M5U35_13040 [Roseovarius sp.]|nr:hypothetical protein [Roseovarius sp.]